MKVQKRCEAGYSLAEMLVVVAMIGILTMVTVPAFITMYQSSKMKTSMRSFTSDLRGVRQLAITKGRQTLLTYGTGNKARTYNWYLGNKPFNSDVWTPLTGSGRPTATRTLNDVIYFPTAGQTFTDSWDCVSSAPNCLALPPAGTGAPDGLIDVLFFPDGHVQLPAGVSSGSIIVKTDMKIPKAQYTISVSPSGRVLAQ
jgi:prepilin-type N-terminal cleavage/methylation domain-containing protein